MGNTTNVLGKDVSKSVRLVRKISNYENGLLLLLLLMRIKFKYALWCAGTYYYIIYTYGFRFKTGYRSVRVCSINIIII